MNGPTTTHCKGREKPDHKPEWRRDETYTADTWLLKCRSCGMVLGNKRTVNDKPVVNLKKFNGYDNYFAGPKGR